MKPNTSKIVHEKILVLESLRGIAALSVAIHHFQVGSHFNNNFTDNAWLMVDFFFVLSGFVITLNYFGKLPNMKSLIQFQKKRFLRLYPLHFLMLIAFISLELFKFLLERFADLSINQSAFSSPNDIFAILANLFLIQNWTLELLTFNYPSWSISAEFFTYAIFGLLLLFCNKNKRKLLIFLSVSIIIFGILLRINGMGTDNISGPLRCLYSFSLGAITFIIYEMIRDKFKLNSSLIPLVLILSAVYLITFYGYLGSEHLVFFPFLFSLVILGLTITTKNIPVIRLLSANWLVFLGKISYGIYMIHLFIWTLIRLVFNKIFGFEYTVLDDGQTILIFDNIYFADIVLMVGVTIIIGMAYISYYWIELKFYKIQNR